MAGTGAREVSWPTRVRAGSTIGQRDGIGAHANRPNGAAGLAVQEVSGPTRSGAGATVGQGRVLGQRRSGRERHERDKGKGPHGFQLQG